ncbi:hypothetical protein ABZ614_03895 [Streptomyces sp. NPDC013178]|uniref:hypothetical protein n=1 Tax=unclassified Streptomyces TaxID=2593676 RepID=UPI0033FCEEB6
MRRLGRQASHGEGDGEPANTVEGYLLALSHHDQARLEAEQLCARMPWLTTAQAEDVAHHYVRQRIDLTRQMLQSTVERAAQLREEYETRYRALRRDLLRRHAAWACALVVSVGGVSTLVSLFTR